MMSAVRMLLSRCLGLMALGLPSASAVPGLPLPSWSGPVPSTKVNASAGLPLVPGVTHHVVYNATAPGGDRNPAGTYNHGPMTIQHEGLFYMSWYNAPRGENVYKRSVFATSADGGETWTAPVTLFENFTTGRRGVAFDEKFCTIVNNPLVPLLLHHGGVLC